MDKTVFFIDDDEIERRSATDVLTEIFSDTAICIVPREPLPHLGDYAEFLTNSGADALILDERLHTAGGIAYTGVQLAAHLRAIGGDLPIMILTNYPDDDFSAQEWAVEDVVQKKCVLKDPNSSAAQTFKARMSRHIEIARKVLAERESRFHDLLVKSVSFTLTPEENEELLAIEGDRLAPVAAAERAHLEKLNFKIEELKKILGEDKLF